MPDKPPFSSSTAETIPPPPSGDSSFKTFRKRDKSERAPSGRVLPPAPEWMQKPLKPPSVRFPTKD